MYQSQKLLIPSLIVVCGLKPVSSKSKFESANVSFTSPGCIGRKFFNAFFPIQISISFMNSESFSTLVANINNSQGATDDIESFEQIFLFFSG